MIKTVELTNFFSFKNSIIDLDQISILIGINGSGKTNFLKSIELLKSVTVEGGLQDLIVNKWGGYDAIFFSGIHESGEPDYIQLKFIFNPTVLSDYGYSFLDPVIYTVRIYKVPSANNYSISETLKTSSGYKYFDIKSGKGFAMEGNSSHQHKVDYSLESDSESIFSQVVDKERYIQIYAVREAIKNISQYNYFDTTPQSLIRKPVIPTSAERLSSDGSNLPQLLNKIKINNKREYNRIRDSLNNINPNYTGIDFNILGTNIELMLEESNLERSIHVTHISDGTLKFLCLLTIIYNSKRGSLVCIDEPESGLHPDMISEIIDGIIEKSKDCQFIISTHSENVLNQLTVKELIVCDKDEENATRILTFPDKDFQEWAAAYSTGRLWRNGDLGGNRY